MPEYIRPLFCEGKGPFRWVALSGDPEDIRKTDQLVLSLFPGDEGLKRWIRLAGERIHFQGLPARICWLGYGQRAKLGLAINELVRSGEISAPIVIGRDHLDTGSVASPYRETEGMLDGSDAVADWPLLNALVNTAAGASWVSIHNGGGVGIGYSQHAGHGGGGRWNRRGSAPPGARVDHGSGNRRIAACGCRVSCSPKLRASQWSADSHGGRMKKPMSLSEQPGDNSAELFSEGL